MGVRAKFRLDEMTVSKSGTEEMRSYKFNPVSGPSDEDKQFWRWSPGGQLTLNCVNPAVWPQFEIGKSYYLDFIPAE